MTYVRMKFGAPDNYDDLKDLTIKQDGKIVEDNKVEESLFGQKKFIVYDGRMNEVDEFKTDKEAIEFAKNKGFQLVKDKKGKIVWETDTNDDGIKESFLNETGEVDSKKCADILNNWIDWTEVDETGDVDFAIDQLRSLASEKQITEEEYDFIMSNWDDLLKEGLNTNKSELKELFGLGKPKLDFKGATDYRLKEAAKDLFVFLNKQYSVEILDNSKIHIKGVKHDMTTAVETISGFDVRVVPERMRDGTFSYKLQSSSKEYDYERPVSSGRNRVRMRESMLEGMKFGQSSYDDAVKVVIDYYRDHSAEDALVSIFNEFQMINEDEAYKLVYSLAEKVEQFVGEELEDSQKYPIESPFEKKEGKDGLKATQKYPVESPMKKKDGQFVKAEQKAPIGESLNESVKIISDLSDFKPWSGAVDTWYKIIDAGKLETLGFMLEDMYPEGISDVGLNDLLWHDSEWVLDMVGISEEQDNEGYDEDEIEDVEESLDKNKIGKGSEYDIDVSPEEADKLAESLVNTINSLENN